MERDVVVLGSSRAACEAALEAARLGLRTLLVPASAAAFETARLQPTQCFFLAKEALRSVPAVPAVSSGGLEAVIEQLDQLHLSRAEEQLASAGVEIDRRPYAKLAHGPVVHLSEGTTCAADFVVVATGARPRRPDRFPFDDRVVCDSESALRFDVLPRSMLVIGAEATGCEMACLFASLGCGVTVVDRRSRCLRYVDRDLLEQLHFRMQRLGIEIVLSEGVQSIEVLGSGGDAHAIVALESGRSEICDRVAIVAGLAPDHRSLGLEEIGVEVDASGFIQSDEWGRTACPGVLAAGTVVANLPASAEGVHGRRVVMAATTGVPDADQPCPVTIDTTPAVAMVGLTREMCVRLDVPVVEALGGFGPFCRDDEGLWRREGTLKLVANEASGEILGVHAIGCDARDVIQLGSWLVHHRASVQDVAEAGFSAHSSSEAYWKAAVRAAARVHASV